MSFYVSLTLDRPVSSKWINKSIVAITALLLLPIMALADPAHYFVVKESMDGSLSVVSHQVVNLSSAIESNGFVAESSRLESQLAVTVQDKTKGDVVFTTMVNASPWLRGEFHGRDEIEGHFQALDDRLYVVRVPLALNATLQLDGFRGTDRDPVQKQSQNQLFASRGTVTKLVLDLDLHTSAAMAWSMPPPPGYAMGSLYNNGPSSNRLDLLIVAEGYTASAQTRFVQQAKKLVDSFLSISPYANYRHLINVSWLFVPSNESGADKPSCAETPGLAVVSVDTAFDATFCTNGSRRAVTVDTSKVLTAAGAVADWDRILVLVNDGEYGGTGGTIGVVTTNSYSVQIMQHEFGHSFTELADEYTDSSYPDFPACSDVAGNKPCEANVSDQTDRTKLKWRQWVDSKTPIPSVVALADPIAAGLWEGARYQTTGMYRQCYNGMMRSLDQPFCHVDGEAFVRRLYGPGWGVPSQGVSLIEPGSLPIVSSLTGVGGSKFYFEATVTGSMIPSGLAVTWLVDGGAALQRSVSAGSVARFSYLPPDALTHTIKLIVADVTTSFLTPPYPQSTRIWTVQAVAGNDYLLGIIKSGTGSGTVTSSPSGINCGASCGASYTSGTSVTLTATPAAGSAFAGWSDACSGTTATCTVSMSAAQSVTAKFMSGPVTSASDITGGSEVAIHVYRALYGQTPSRALFDDFTSQIGASNGYAWAADMAADFSNLNDSDFVTLIMTNLGLLGHPELHDPLMWYFGAAGIANRGTVVIQLSEIIADLEGDVAWRAAAAAFNAQCVIDFNTLLFGP